MQEFYNLSSNTDGPTLNIAINEVIGGPSGVTSNDISKILNENTDVKDIKVEINSAGGSISQAVSIFNQLQSSKANVTTVATGIAASSGSIIFMAGDSRIVQRGAFVMIHKPMSIGVNNAEEMREKADLLDRLQESIVDIYEVKTGLGRQEISTLMNKETWLNPEEALDKGFATESTEDSTEPQNKIEYEEFVNSCTKDIPKEARHHFKNYKSNRIQQVLNKLKNVVLNINPNEDDMNKEEVQAMLAENNSKLESEYSNKLEAVQTDFTNKLTEKDGVINSLQETVTAQNSKIDELKNSAANSTIENIVDGFINSGKIAPKDRDIEIQNFKFRESDNAAFEGYKNSVSNREPVINMNSDFAHNGADLETVNLDETIEALLNDAGLTSDSATQEQYLDAVKKAGVK